MVRSFQVILGLVDYHFTLHTGYNNGISIGMWKLRSDVTAVITAQINQKESVSV